MEFNMFPPSRGFNLQDYLAQLSAPAPSMSVPYSPVKDPSAREYLSKLSVGGNAAKAPQWQNPYAFQSWGSGLPEDASFGLKLGDFLGGNAPLIFGGLQTLSGLTSAYTGLKGLGLAEDQLRQQKKEFNINLTNQTQAFNTEVADRIAGRQYNSEAERQAALAAATLVDRSKYGKGR
jgi:hypothetical protein